MTDTHLAELVKRGWRYALALTGSEADADDLVQEAWASSLQAGAELSRAYLFRAIRSRWVDRWRKQGHLQLVDTEGLSSTDGTVERIVAADWLAPAWATLRPEEREALHLCVVEGHTAAEVAALTDRPRNSVLSLLHRGRAKLRAALTQADQEVGL